MSNAQTTLGAFNPSAWMLVDEHPENPSGYGVDCPDCGQPMDVGHWPVPEPDLAGVHGFGCARCQNVVPTQVTESEKTIGCGDSLYVAEASFRDGSRRSVRAVDTR